mmetsp:Transcript_10779/g.9503  ORF Transcript_10779/g.9503 Transcript_10779/m.9503 type:complete len:243 (-) Transcript_10779:47-775(-)
MPKYHLSSYIEKEKFIEKSKIIKKEQGGNRKSYRSESNNKGLSTREKSSRLTQVFDLNTINNYKSSSKEKIKKGSLGKSFKKLNFKKKSKVKNSTFDFTNFQAAVNKKDKISSKSKSKERQAKEVETEFREVTCKENGHKKSYYIPVTITNRVKDGKSTRSNSRTKTVSIKKVNFIKNASSNLNIHPKMQKVKAGKKHKTNSKSSEKNFGLFKHDLLIGDSKVKMIVKPKKHIKAKKYTQRM